MDRVRLALTWRRLSKHLSRMQASVRRPLDVLELGYGRGILLHKLIEAGYHVSGVERHLLSIDQTGPSIAGVTLYDATAEECTLSDECFDFVFAIHVVEHLIDLHAVFRKVAAALRPGGVFYCMTPNAQSYGLSLFGASWWNLEDPTHYRFFSQRSLETALLQAGFRTARSHIVIEDSLTLEINSALRLVSGGDRVHGILHTPGVRAVNLALTPLAVLARLCVPRLSPSIEAIAVKG
jgi:2-polyprenyl-3-methyl-5-hydroxy-6-metoxy-1,4-benzoquinol methylase